jgi:hypothetical protein
MIRVSLSGEIITAGVNEFVIASMTSEAAS